MFGMPDASLKAIYLIKTHYIVKVIEFHPEDQTVDVIQDVCEFTNTTSGSITVQNELGFEATVAPKRPSVFYGIPVKQERWGQFEIQCCPQPGDTGYLEIFTNDITDWIENGGVSIPMSDRHFAMDSCIFVPFVPNKQNCVDDYPTDGTKLVIKSNNATVTITDSQEEGQDPVVDIETNSKTVHINADDGITIKGDLDITGDLTMTGDVNITGDVAVTGAISATGEISSQTDVVVKTVLGNVSLLSHTHTSAAPGSPTSTPTPVPPTPQGV